MPEQSGVPWEVVRDAAESARNAHDAIRGIGFRLDTIEAREAEARKAVAALDKALRGNGGKGILERMNNHDDAVERVHRRLDDAFDEIGKHKAGYYDRDKMRWWALGQLITALAAGASVALHFIGG